MVNKFMLELINSGNIIKKIQIIICMILLPFLLNAEIAIQIGYSLSSVSPRGFSLFTNSYNGYHNSELSKKIDVFKPGSGFNININYLFNEYGMINFGYNYNSSSTIATFVNGNSRIFDQTLSYLEFEIGGGKKINKIGIYSGIGTLYGISTIDSYYKYNNGNLNFGTGYFLNGKYKGRFKALTLAIKSTYDLSDKLSIFIKLTGFHYIKPKSYQDKDASKIFKNPKSNYISTDYQHFFEIYNHYNDTPEQYQLKSDIRGIRSLIGFQYYIK